MKIKNLFIFLFLSITSLFSISNAQQLQSIEVIYITSNNQEIRYHFDKAISGINHFMNKDRIVVDFPKAKIKSSQKNKQINNNFVQNITNVVGSNGKMRSTMKLTGSAVDYGVSLKGSTIVVSLTKSNLLTKSNTSVAELTSTSNSAGTDQDANLDYSKNRINFSRNSKGFAVIEIELPSKSTESRIIELDKQLQINLNNYSWKKSDQKRYSVSDFGTPVKQVDVINVKGNASINITTNANFDYSAYQTGSKYIIEVKPKKIKQTTSLVQNSSSDNFTGERLSLNFQNIEVRAVLQIIADFTGLNIVISDEVGGNITLRLIDVPWDQALDVILKTKSLGMQQQGQIVFIAPAKVIQDLSNNEPIISEIIQINYAKASDIAAVLTAGKGSSTTGVTNSAGLSSRGTVSVDTRTNNLIIQDTASQIMVIKDLLKVLDRAVQQVQIDARIVIATDDFARDLGVKWGGGQFHDGKGNSRKRAISGSIEGNSSIMQTIYENNNKRNNPENKEPIIFPVPFGGGTNIVNLPATSSAGQIAFTVLKKSFLLEMELSAMQSKGKGETLASPRVFTADRKPAYIKSGKMIPISKSDEAGNTITTFVEALISLNVTPEITPDNRVILDLVITKDDPVTGSGGVAIDKNEIKTNVIVEDGETVVLGGVYNEITGETVKKIPYLSDIPFLGKLFQNKSVSRSKAELLIFVRPQISNSNKNI